MDTIEQPKCAACNRPALYSVAPPAPFDTMKPWRSCENHLPPMEGITYSEYRDAVRPI